MGKIISTPKSGWSSLNLPEYRGELSYIDDIPIMFCNLIEQYKKQHTAACDFDCEGYSFLLILSEYSIDILEFKESETPTLFHSEMDPNEFCKQILEDLSNDMYPWINTYYYEKEEPTEWKSYQCQLIKALNKCKNLYQKHGSGICPVCGNEDLEYDVLTPYGNSISYPWTCNHCHTKGNEIYDLTFSHHENIEKENKSC